MTTNQALIVALGKTFTSDSTAVVADTSSVDEAHAAPDSPCYGCHKTLDPMRDFLRQSYTYWGSERTASRYNEAVPAQASFTWTAAPWSPATASGISPRRWPPPGVRQGLGAKDLRLGECVAPAARTIRRSDA